MKIINYGHACFKIEDDGVSIVFDPYQDNSVPGLKLPNNLASNYVFASHDHCDHNAVEKVTIIPNGKSIDMTEISLPHDDCGGRKRGMSVARVIRFQNYSICHMGDIGDVDAVIKCDALKNIDIVLCPINGFFTISAEDAIQLQQKMGWKLLIPMHYEIKEKGIGYPDGNQIGIFKKLLNKENFLNIGDYMIEVNDFYMTFKSLIFLAHL